MPGFDAALVGALFSASGLSIMLATVGIPTKYILILDIIIIMALFLLIAAAYFYRWQSSFFAIPDPRNKDSSTKTSDIAGKTIIVILSIALLIACVWYKCLPLLDVMPVDESVSGIADDSSSLSGNTESSSYVISASSTSVSSTSASSTSVSSTPVSSSSFSGPYLINAEIPYEDLGNYPKEHYTIRSETLYRYRSRTSELYESNNSTVPGAEWALVNSSTIAVTGNWQESIPSGLYETGYLYYCYGFNYKDDLTYIFGPNRQNVINHAAKAYPNLNDIETRVNYFWTIQQSNRGMEFRDTLTVTQEGFGQVNITNTIMYYLGIRYKQTEQTIYTFKKWNEWNAWTSWATTLPPASNDGLIVESESRMVFYVTSK